MASNAERSEASKAAFVQRLAEHGVTSLWTEWRGTKATYHCICTNGHECWPRPNQMQQGDGPCFKCGAQLRGRMATTKAEVRFRANLITIGATPTYGEWRGVHEPHDVICANGHACNPAPVNIQAGQGPCRICAGNDPALAEAAFGKLLAELGATPGWVKWAGSREPHRVICADGHECWPIPHVARRGISICSICSGKDPATAEANYREYLAGLRVTPLWEHWEGKKKSHHVLCTAGHDCHPKPEHVLRGQGVCLTCVGHDSAEGRYREHLFKLGHIPAWDEWRGVKKPHKVLCAGGHICSPAPADVMRPGAGPCGTCARNSPVAAQMEFRDRLADLGAAPAWEKWEGTTIRHRVVCSEGHICWIRPAYLKLGKSPCRICSKKWDIFYVVVNDDLGWVKFGITSEDPRVRLKAHRTDGFRRTVRVASITGAKLVEEHVQDVLTAHGYRPVRGREYFLLPALEIILKTAQSYDPETEMAP